jgi:hypothetical protein
MAFDTASVTLGDLVLGERHQQTRSGPAFLVGALGEGRPDVFDGGQAQFAEQQGDAGRVEVDAHAQTSVSQFSSAS